MNNSLREGAEDSKESMDSAEYLTYVAAAGDMPESYEMRYENVWLTQRMMAKLYGVSVPAINLH